jgi:site-specific DNA recombinase
MRRGRQRKLRAGGLLPWTRAPYGYRTDPDRPRDLAGVRLEPAEAAVVSELFARYTEHGMSLRRLALALSAKATPTPSGRWRLPSGDPARHFEQPHLHRTGLCRA